MVRFRNFSAALRSRRNARENLEHLAFVIHRTPEVPEPLDMDEFDAWETERNLAIQSPPE